MSERRELDVDRPVGRKAATIARFLAGHASPEVEDALARLARAPDVVHVAVMPDVHLAEEVCVGVAVATTRLIYPAAVGGDLGCGMAALRLDVPATALDEDAAARVLDGLYRRIPRDRHRRADWRALPDTLDPEALSAPPLVRLARGDGQAQLGTLGSGNHFVELQADDDDGLWLMLHSGSRGLGPAIRAHHEAVAPAAGHLRALDTGSEAGRAYLADLAWALAWADANRRALADAATAALADALDARPVEGTWFTCQHNHVRRETHGGRALWVHRKGAMSARDGEPGIIPGSMGTPSFHVTGRGLEAALASSAHGAGRAMSRTAARRAVSLRALARQMDGVFWDHRRAQQLRDEAPAAYKDIGAVMRAQRELVGITRRLRPLLSYKAA